jgi:hypothetical protein
MSSRITGSRRSSVNISIADACVLAPPVRAPRPFERSFAPLRGVPKCRQKVLLEERPGSNIHIFPIQKLGVGEGRNLVICCARACAPAREKLY